jgi:hypothetical protein
VVDPTANALRKFQSRQDDDLVGSMKLIDYCSLCCSKASTHFATCSRSMPADGARPPISGRPPHRAAAVTGCTEPPRYVNVVRTRFECEHTAKGGCPHG